MLKNRKRNMQKQANKASSCMKVPTRKMTRLEHARQNIFKSLTNPVNQICSEFVILNKKKILEKLIGKVFKNLKDFGKQGCLFFNILYLNFRKLCNIINLLKNCFFKMRMFLVF